MFLNSHGLHIVLCLKIVIYRKANPVHTFLALLASKLPQVVLLCVSLRTEVECLFHRESWSSFYADSLFMCFAYFFSYCVFCLSLIFWLFFFILGRVTFCLWYELQIFSHLFSDIISYIWKFCCDSYFSYF